jgi:HSP20 family protein
MTQNDVPVANGQGATTAPNQTPAPSAQPTMPARVPTPFTAVRRMMEDLDRTFEDWSFGKEWLAPVFGRDPLVKRFEEFGKNVFLPDVEVVEKGENLIIRADLPGMKKEEIDVEVTDGTVVLKGERRQEEKEEKEGYYRSERSYGSFYRSIPLPAKAIAGSATATFNDGVLEVTVKTEKPNGRKVDIA